MDFKLIGSILLIIGTSLGAGMLGLPIATAELGFTGSLVLLIVCWFVMTAGALLLLEVNLWLPHNSNIISMAKATLGPLGQVIAWLTYLLLLYSLLCAYISGGSDLFHHLLTSHVFTLSEPTCAFLFTFIFGSIVFLGIRSVDYVNRGLMIVKFIAYSLLIALLMPFIKIPNLVAGDLKQLTAIGAITVTVTSFGYASIVPSLRMYFGGDLRKIKLAILIGSLVPLLCYIFWDAAIMGVIPLHGTNGLVNVLHSQNANSQLVTTLTSTVTSNSVTFFMKLFTSICVLTSFLGVGLCVTDFLADGLQLEKKGGANLFIHALTFLPPLIIVLFFPNIFIKALEYAGIYCIILLILLPALMVWHGRYRKHLSSGFKVAGGKTLLVLLIAFAIVAIVQSVLSNFV